MDALAEQIVLDYLRLLADAAQRILGPDERQTFLARTRAAIARQVSETRVADPRDVQRLLRRFGDPQKLAAKERQRLDNTPPTDPGSATSTPSDPAHTGTDATPATQNGRPAPPLATPHMPGSAARPEPPGPPVSAERPGLAERSGVAGSPLAMSHGPGSAVRPEMADAPVSAERPGLAERPARAGRPAGAGRRPAMPVPHRPLTARWRPGIDLTAAPRPVPPVLRTLSRWPDTPRRAGHDRAGHDGTGRDSTRRDGEDPDPDRPRDRVPAAAGASGPGGGSGPRGPSPDRGSGPRGSGPDGWSRPGGAAGVAEPGTARDWLDGLFVLVRRYPLECAAIAVLGVGGLIDPFPLWMLGGLAVLVSRLWDTRDKLAAVAVPMAVALLGAIMLGGLNAKTASLSGYAHGVHTDGWDLIRAGAVLGAVYLAWRMRQGPRPQPGPPPWRHSRRI